MPTPISVDLRIRIVEARVQDGQTYEQLAERFHVGRATVDRVLRLQRETGSVEPKPHGGGVGAADHGPGARFDRGAGAGAA
ncbi:helix-turn-helix domain-containing protein [Nannocystis exedens]|uniref:helix-turn-helix domain-containing protein n=1 Tax=Nannocystis exedens TaxID=54 RepID=UPI001180A53C